MKNMSTHNLRTPPQNIDAERALLGSIMLRPIAIMEILDAIQEDDFYVQKHKIIFRTMVERS